MYGKVRKLKKSEDDDYNIIKRVNNFWNNNYIEHGVMMIEIKTYY